ncbi:hypothetical protein SALBM217S_01766 [Streptomyces griseoloalbus]
MPRAHPGAAGQGGGDRIPGGGGGTERQGAGADGAAQRRRGAARRADARRGGSGRRADRGGAALRAGQGGAAGRGGLGERLPGGVERGVRILDGRGIRARPGGGRAAVHLAAGAGDHRDDQGGGGAAGGRAEADEDVSAGFPRRVRPQGGERLAAAAAEVPVEGDLLPVLASREVAVGERVERLFPSTTTTRLRGVGDVAGWRKGAGRPRRRLPPPGGGWGGAADVGVRARRRLRAPSAPTRGRPYEPRPSVGRPGAGCRPPPSCTFPRPPRRPR